MAELARQATVDKAKGLTIIEMDERTASPTASNSSTHNSKPIKPLQRAKTVNFQSDVDYFVSKNSNISREEVYFELALWPFFSLDLVM